MDDLRPPYRPTGPAPREWQVLCGYALMALAATAGCVSDPGANGGGGNAGSGNHVGSGGSGPGSGGNPGNAGAAGTGPGTGGISGGAGTGAAGTSGTGGTGGDTSIPPPPSALPAESACTSQSPGPRMLRRLSALEFAATIPDLFGDTTVPVSTVFNDSSVLGFSIDAGTLLVQDLNADQLMSNAEAIAHWAVTTPAVLARVAPCTTTDDACQTKFITAFGKRAFRAPLGADRVTAYKAIFAGEASFSDGAEAVISAMLQSPYFLYRSELGSASGAMFALTPYEVASSLSYLLTGSMPDAALMAAADGWSGTPTTTQLDTQVQRLLADPRSSATVMRFMTGWLGLDRLFSMAKDATIFPLTDALKNDMMSETTSLVLEAFNNNGAIADLLTADHSFLNQNLAQFYGISAGGLGTSMTRVAYPTGGARDRGILAHASVLNGYARPDLSSPTQRGHMVRSRLLCQNVPPPDNKVDTTLNPPSAATPTTRSLYEQHIQKGTTCSGCHKLMDPIGFGFENYDGFGRYRTTENGSPIDPSGTIYTAGTTGMDVKFANLTELQTYLAGSTDVDNCMIRYWAYYAYGSASWQQDACTYGGIRQEAAAGSYALQDVLKAIVHAPHFTNRVQDQ